jgi:hypothetical protein
MGLEEEFTQALEDTVEAVRGKSYYPHYFMQMLGQYGGLETARRLLAKEDPQAGLLRLYDIGMLSESLEAVALRPKFRPLFTEAELAEAHRRLEELGNFGKGAVK